MAALTQRPKNLVREYETIYILKGDVDAPTAEKIASRVSEVVARESGKLIKVENWGRRKLAYAIHKQRRGVYTYLKFLGGGALVAELERNLRMQDAVVRFQTVQLRTDVPVDSVAIDPEETKFAPLAQSTEADDDDAAARERQLGFVEDAPKTEADDFADADAEASMNPDLVEEKR